jgi:hypothetical protein
MKLTVYDWNTASDSDSSASGYGGRSVSQSRLKKTETHHFIEVLEGKLCESCVLLSPLEISRFEWPNV